MARYRHIDVRPLTGALGAEILGIDLRRLDEEAFAEIQQAFLEHLVIFFRDQALGPADLEAFARRFGRLDPHHVLEGLPGHPDVLEIVREPTDEGVFAPGWHADVTWQEEPVMGAMLYGLEVPAVGGDTLFANQYLAYETLSAGMRKLLDGLRAVHGTAKVYGADAQRYTHVQKLRVDQGEAAKMQSAHPVVRTHPETGRKALFVNAHYTLRFDEMSEEESRPLLSYLFEHAVKPELTCRFRWYPGSLAFWDNRCTLHTPIDDYFGSRRRMLRVTIAGDWPR